MRPLTDDQLKRIEKIIQEHTGVLLGVFGGGKSVSSEWLEELGLDPKSPSFIEQAYILGKLNQTLTSSELSKLTYDALLARIGETKLTKMEQEALSYAQRQAGRHVTNAERKITMFIDDANNRIGQKTMMERDVIGSAVADSISRRQTRGQLVSELGRATGDWTRDWERVANTELWDARLAATTRQILTGDTIYSSLKGKEARVFRRPAPDSCNHCKRLYLESDGVTPKIFKLHELISNGDNVGRKTAEWLPTVHPTHPNCFVDGNVRVLTSTGYKKIREINVGESVLTHMGRFKTVTHTLSEYNKRYAGDIYTIAYKGQYGKLKKLRVTPEHKFLTQEGWKRADEISNEDSLRMLTLPCEDCGEDFDVINDRLTCKTCTHILEHPVERKNGGLYSLDIALPEEKTNIEYDGSYFHQDLEKDKKRDAELGEMGWTVIRYRDYVPTPEELKEDLNRVMSNHNGKYKFRDYPIEHVTCEKATNHKLHDITVADDHSFIVEGVVSHNCNCPMEAVPDGFVFDQNGDLVPE